MFLAFLKPIFIMLNSIFLYKVIYFTRNTITVGKGEKC